MTRPDLQNPSPDWLAALAARLGPGGAVDPAEGARYFEEPRGRFQGSAALIARPKDAAAVQAVVRACAAARVGLVPYGGGTGLVGGQTRPAEGPAPILLSLERLNAIRSVSVEENALTAEAGATLASVRAGAEAERRLFPLSLASEGSAQIGGVLAANAGGVGVLRYGNARDLCLGVEAVLANGELLSGLSSLRKNNTGFDLRHLLIGSEGALGVITAASLKLFAQPRERAVAMAALASVEDAIALLRRLQDALGETVSAFELISAQSFVFLAEAEIPNIRPPFETRPPFAALIEIGGADARRGAEQALATALEAGLLHDVVVATSEAQADGLWRLREEIPSANRRIGAVASHDVALPIATIPAFLTEAERRLAALDERLRVNVFGHLGDGNLHFNLFPPQGVPREEFDAVRAPASRLVHDLVHEMGGTFSAEHGIGRLKTADLKLYGDPAHLAAMRAIKAALDPAGIMNPGVLGL